jgi:alginate O-acetyltransferase complex protein AlgI
MIFNTLAYYFAFLLPTAFFYRVVPIPHRPKIVVLSGCLFFSFFAYAELGSPIGALCLLIFIWESCFSRLYRPRSPICFVGIAMAALILFVFKYWNFVVSLLPWEGAADLRWRSQFLPLGISFFTFEFIHYAVDRYKGKAEKGGFWEYFAFILFFPTMVAGPIKRFQDFIPKLRGETASWASDWERGITRILSGLAKKLGVADVMTAFTGNLHAATIQAAHRPALLLYLFAYGVQIYFDFSGYSDIAIGSARLIGIRVPENFDWPYLQENISKFWQHWHMSLTRWLIDYIYIPLGGSRVALPRIMANLLITFLVSGIWHGAGLNFIAWGLWHGLLLCILRLYRTLRPEPILPPAIGRFAAWAATFCAVNLGWAFFCMDLPTATLFFRRLLVG